MINWFRPSMQIPWYISKATKALVAPLLGILEVHKTYWETWHEVFRYPK